MLIGKGVLIKEGRGGGGGGEGRGEVEGMAKIKIIDREFELVSQNKSS